MRLCAIQLPLVLKTDMTVHVEVRKSTSIDDVKRAVFESFWSQIKPFNQKSEHGNFSQVSIFDGKLNEITDSCCLRERMAESATISAIFTKHPKIHD